MHLKNEPNPAMSAEVSNARFGSFAAQSSRRQSPAMSVQFAGCDPPLWIARMAGIRGSLSSLRERFRARRGRALRWCAGLQPALRSDVRLGL